MMVTPVWTERNCLNTSNEDLMKRLTPQCCSDILWKWMSHRAEVINGNSNLAQCPNWPHLKHAPGSPAYFAVRPPP